MANTLGGLKKDDFVQCTDKDGQISALFVKTGSVSAQVSVDSASFTFTSNGKDLSAAFAKAATTAGAAGKLSASRSITLQVNAAANSGTAASFDGAADLTVKLPATLCCAVLGNATTSTSATYSVSAEHSISATSSVSADVAKNALSASAAASATTAASAAEAELAGNAALLSVGSFETACLNIGGDAYVLSSVSLALADGTSFEGIVFVKKAEEPETT